MAHCFGALRPRFSLMHSGCPIEQVYLYRESIDFRKAINGLSVLVEQELGLSPFASALYVFTDRRHNKVKALYWHRNGFCLWQKRLEHEKVAWPSEENALTKSCTLQEFGWLRSGPAILNSAISGNSGHKAWPMPARQEGVFDGQEISATHPSHPYTHVQGPRGPGGLA
jgi:transposase